MKNITPTRNWKSKWGMQYNDVSNRKFILDKYNLKLSNSRRNFSLAYKEVTFIKIINHTQNLKRSWTIVYGRFICCQTCITEQIQGKA